MATSKSRKVNLEELEKLQKEEETRNRARQKAQKNGKSISSDKSKLKNKKLPRPARKVTKKRASVR